MEKTLQELYDEVVKDSNIIKEFTEAEKEGKLEEFAKAHGCSATEEEIKKFVESKKPNGKELSPEELDQVAGGYKSSPGYRPNGICNKCKKDYPNEDIGKNCSCGGMIESPSLTVYPSQL